VQLQEVQSENLKAVGYDKATKVMRILFQSGSCYDYAQVPLKVHKALMASESKGEYFQREIVGGMYSYTKADPRRESTMGKNNQQKQSEARKAAATNAAPTAVAEQPKPTPAPAPTPVPVAVSKQDATIQKLKDGWTAKGVDLSKLTIKDDGKFKVLQVTPEWPSVQVGASGGITVLELRSYPDGFTGAMEGLERFNKQKARDAKKATAPAAAPTAQPKAPEPQKATTPAARKKAQHQQVEQQLQSAQA